MTQRNGIYQNLDIIEYHKDDAISSSGIKEFIESPYNYWYKYLNPNCNSKKKTECMRIGEQAHVSLLEPEKFKEKYLVCLEEHTSVFHDEKTEEKIQEIKIVDDKRTCTWKKFEKSALKQNKVALTLREYNRYNAMVDEIKSNTIIAELLTGGEAEVSFFGQLKEFDLRIKGRPDYIKRTKNGLKIIDYKTVSGSLSQNELSNKAFKNNQHVQAAIHSMAALIATGIKVEEVVYIIQSTEEPYLLRYCAFDATDIDLGTEKAMHFLEQISYCQNTNNWSKPSTEKEFFTRPKWVDYEEWPTYKQLLS